jgi:hypothetical protein
MSDDFILLGEGINFILIMIRCGSSHSSLKTPIPVRVVKISGILGCE